MTVYAVPGSMWPGSIWLADPISGTAPSSLYPYYGHATLNYLDYVDSVSEHTLVAVPGGSYSMLAVNNRAGLTVPPPDGRWTIGGGGMAMARRRATPAEALAVHGHYPGAGCRLCDPLPAQAPPPPLAESSIHGHYQGAPCRQCDPVPAAPAPPPLTAGALHGHYPGAACRQCDPVLEEPPLVRRGPGPDFAPPPPPVPPMTAEESRAVHGHHNAGDPCRHCDPVLEEPPLVRRMPGPDFAPQPSMAQVRAALAQSSLGHGHYDDPAGCKQCAGAEG